MMEKLGFVGLGIMGQPMALHLLDREPLVVYNRTQARTEPLRERGAEVAESPSELAQACTLIFLMLSNDEAVESLVAGPQGLLAGVQSGTLIVDHSTISPRLTRTLADAVRQRGGDWLDAPVTGGDIGAREATLTIMAGGREAAFARARVFLERMGRRIVHVGEVGQGQTLKLIANLVSGMTLMAASEGVRMGLHLGLRVEDMATVMTYGSAQSFELSKVLDRLGSQNYAPGFSVENRFKDLRLAIALAEEAGFAADLGRASEELYRRHLEAGYGSEDEASYIKRWESE
ncbi:MAG: NAD(P)-dependent oxidoreductase [Firmicutes bacterium]|nr:NAD(P)-dependent oxidoreductase [Bacillota bacterium]